MHLDTNYRNRDTEMPAPNSFLYPFLGIPKVLRHVDGNDPVELGREYCQVKLYVTKTLGSASLVKMIQNAHMNIQKWSR